MDNYNDGSRVIDSNFDGMLSFVSPCTSFTASLADHAWLSYQLDLWQLLHMLAFLLIVSLHAAVQILA